MGFSQEAQARIAKLPLVAAQAVAKFLEVRLTSVVAACTYVFRTFIGEIHTMCEGPQGHCAGHSHHSCRCSGIRLERFIEPCLLLLLVEKTAHGYELIARLSEMSLGVSPDPGMVYRNLRRLEEQGMIRSEWDTSGTGPARRYYEVTEEGRELLRAWVKVIAENVRALESFLERARRANL